MPALINELLDKMHNQKETPEHIDQCDHPKGSFVGSIQHLNHEHKEEWLDVYVYEDKIDGTSVCIRYGSEGSQYISPGSIFNVIQSGMQRRGDAYELAFHVIKKHGKITFVRNE